MCNVKDCLKEVHSKGMCQAHYRLFKKYGVPQVLAKEDRHKPGPAAKEKPEKVWVPKLLSTHCKYGHEYTEESTYYWGTTRHCRVCSKETMRERRKNLPRVGQGTFNSSKTHCPQGHEYTEENTYTNPQGRRQCRTCSKENGAIQNIKRYGISVAQFTDMIEEQNNRCAICQTEFLDGKVPHIDHDHSCCSREASCGKCVRGLLCVKCNYGLGNFEDNIQSLYAAIEYLSARIKTRDTILEK